MTLFVFGDSTTGWEQKVSEVQRSPLPLVPMPLTAFPDPLRRSPAWCCSLRADIKTLRFPPVMAMHVSRALVRITAAGPQPDSAHFWVQRSHRDPARSVWNLAWALAVFAASGSHFTRAAAIDCFSNRVFHRLFWLLMELSDKEYTAHPETFFFFLTSL